MIKYWMEVILVGMVGAASVAYLIYKRNPWLKYDWQWLKMMLYILRMYKKLARENKMLVDMFEEQAKRIPDKTFLVYQDNLYSYGLMESQANKAAAVAKQLGLKKGDTVAVMIHNEPAFIWTYLGFLKLGVQAALLNVNLRSRSLLHCFKVSEAKVLIVGQGDDLSGAVEDIQEDLSKLGTTICVQGATGQLTSGFTSYDEMFASASEASIPRSERAGVGLEDCIGYIYTSGTTGLPKSAIVPQSKCMRASTMVETMNITAADVVYTAMPLYHAAALYIAMAGVIRVGCTLVLRRKFSATHFWEDCRRNDVTIIQYIGELCRYLIAKPPSADDRDHKVRAAIGSGLRMDIWQEFQQRFQVPMIMELYAATENNIGFMNFFNKTGAVGRHSPLSQKILPVYFIKYDYETAGPVRDEGGFCVQVKQGEPGLMVCRIKKDLEFYGYKGNEEQSTRKVLRDVFRKGDMYVNSGDLFIQDEEYFLYFSDRIGDTFRWKGENVSTVEVANVVGNLAWVEDANVYGVAVPGHDGRAGMAAILLSKEEKLSDSRLQDLYHLCQEYLPSYARPKFLRFKPEIAVTSSTMKQMKVDLVEEGFDPAKIKGEPMYCVDNDKATYIPLDASVYEKVVNGVIRL